MDGFKTFYNEKNGKAILFFGFYLIFFVFLIFYLRSFDTVNPVDGEGQEKIITTYDISNLINNDYQYNIEITDNDEVITFNGTKSNVDYANYTNKYFLDIYNINQLLKKSTFIESKDYVLTYELKNKVLNELLLTEKSSGKNNIKVYVNEKGEVNKIIMDLTNYFEKENYQITINYTIGEENENSPS